MATHVVSSVLGKRADVAWRSAKATAAIGLATASFAGLATAMIAEGHLVPDQNIRSSQTLGFSSLCAVGFMTQVGPCEGDPPPPSCPFTLSINVDPPVGDANGSQWTTAQDAINYRSAETCVNWEEEDIVDTTMTAPFAGTTDHGTWNTGLQTPPITVHSPDYQDIIVTGNNQWVAKVTGCEVEAAGSGTTQPCTTKPGNIAVTGSTEGIPPGKGGATKRDP
jgi:hypothetical protein